MLFSANKIALAFFAGATVVAALPSSVQGDQRLVKRNVVELQERANTVQERGLLDGLLGSLGLGGTTNTASTTALLSGLTTILPLPAQITDVLDEVTTTLDGLTSGATTLPDTSDLDLTDLQSTIAGLTSQLGDLGALTSQLQSALNAGSLTSGQLSDLSDLPATLTSVVEALLSVVTGLLSGLTGGLPIALPTK